jgi:predicted transposase/invertase (TIGR01784 family)
MIERKNIHKEKKSTLHDGFIKRVLGDIIVATEFLDEYLPEQFKEIVDMSTLAIEQESFVEPDLTKQLSDIVYSLRMRNNDKAFVYCLIEAQSSPDYWIAFRLWRYMWLLLEKHAKGKNKLPIILPLVIYNGKARYIAPLNLWDLFSDPALAKTYMGGDYRLIDLQAMLDDQINYEKHLSLITYVMKHITERDMLLMMKNALQCCKNALIIDRDRNYIHIKHVLWYISNKVPEERIYELEQLMADSLQQKNEDFMGTIAQSYEQRGFKKGVIQGREKGIEKGIERGIEKGIEKGIEMRNIELAKKMLQFGADIEFVTKVTGLSAREIKKL